MLRVALVLAGALAAIAAIVTAVGYALPVAHTASRRVTLQGSPDRVFAALEDIEQYPAWRSDVQRIEVLGRAPSTRWREHGSSGEITFEIAERHPPAKLVSRIVDPSLPFGGSWTYELAPGGNGTILTITEHGEVYNPLFRVMSRFVFGHTATLDRFLADLQKRVDAGSGG